MRRVRCGPSLHQLLSLYTCDVDVLDLPLLLKVVSSIQSIGSGLSELIFGLEYVI